MLNWLFRSKRTTVLMAWELGGGMGHINRLLLIAAKLSAEGHRIVLALRGRPDETLKRALPGATFHPAPVWVRPPQSEAPRGYVFNYADVLFRCGYDIAENIGPVIGGWRDLLESTCPSLVVCDHSPSVVLAAAGRVPVVHIGSGFATPPAGRSFFPLHAASSSGAKEREAQVLATLDEIHQQLGTPEVKRVSDLLGLAENIPCCLPELDPYKSVRAEPASGPVQKLPPLQPLDESANLFGYLNGDDLRTARILESLAKAQVACGIYVREGPPDWEQIVAETPVALFSAPQKMPDAASAAVGIIHHGGLSTTETALALGRPQFLFPRNLEQTLTADAVERMGCGVNLAKHGDPGDAIRRALKQGKYRKESAAIAARIAARPSVDVLDAIVQRCTQHLASIQK